MGDMVIPSPIALVLRQSALGYVARLALAAPFLTSGATKLLDLQGATNEVGGLGLQPAGLLAGAVIVTQLGGSLLFLTRRYCWLGAGILADFTAFATLLAHSFWSFDGPDQGRQAATFFEHVAIVSGLAMAALFVNGRRVRP